MKKQKSDVKKFDLTAEEKGRLVAIRNVGLYMQDLIRGDMNMYVDGIIKPRLALGREINVTVDIDKGVLETIPAVVDEAVEEIKPALEKVEEPVKKEPVVVEPKAGPVVA